MGRPRTPSTLDPEARALWNRVTASVRPLGGRHVVQLEEQAFDKRKVSTVDRSSEVPAGKARTIANTLDGGWDRRLGRGVMPPERTVDLHGHTLASAHTALDMALARAVADGTRLLLVVTGKPQRPGEKRGAIRAAIGDWLTISRHAGHIAAVRNAHPKHGGSGALYIVLRRSTTSIDRVR